MSKKKRLMIRIVCGLLCLVMILGCVMPYVQAAEISEDVLDELYEIGSQAGQDLGLIEDQDDLVEPETPTSTLPAGFEYSYENGYWEVIKTEGFEEVGFMLDGVPDGFDQQTITFFVGNVETREVVPVTVNYLDGYVSSAALSDGYYVLFSNDYVWSDKDGNAFAVNNHSFFYFCVGDVDSTKYGNNFYTEEPIFNIKLTKSENKDKAFAYGKSLTAEELKSEFPKTVVFGEEDKELKEDKEDVEEHKNILQILMDTLKNIFVGSWYLIAIIVVGGIVYNRLKKKRLMMLEEQTENDKYDDRSVE